MNQLNQLINLIPNSSFEKFEYFKNANKPDTIKIANWNVSSENQINGYNAYSGAYSMKLNKDEDISAIFSEYNTQSKYYFRVYYKLSQITKKTTILNMSLVTTNNDDIYSNSCTLDNTKSNDWEYWSFIIDRIEDVNEIFTNPKILFSQSTKDDLIISIDSVMLINLTDVFDKGFEPSHEWCDNFIPYFENEYCLPIESKAIHFLNIEDVIYDYKSKKRYCNTFHPTFSFVVKNVDKQYNTDNLQDVLIDNKIKVEYEIYDKTNAKTAIGKKEVNVLDIQYVDNDAFITCSINFGSNRHHATITILSDYSIGTRAVDSVTIYFVGNKYKYLEYNLDSNLSYASTYLRKLKGTTNKYNDVPTTIDVFINGVKTSPVNILYKGDELTEFEKEIYLSDGNNYIEVVATDICGNKQSKGTSIYVDCMTPTPEKVDLLTNFIGNDDSTISLSIGNADLKYQTSSAGLSKEIDIDTSIDSHYFKLVGKNSNLYRISKNNIPKIQGDIIKRPLSIDFDYVEKIYDGNNDITLEMNKLELDNGYRVRSIHKEYNDHISADLIRGTFERKINTERKVELETIFQRGENIITNYVLDKPNIDYTNAYIIIDDYEGYSLYDENTKTAEFIFRDDYLDKWFESIMLSRNEDNTTTINFKLNKNSDSYYKVSDKVNIKYNYSIVLNNNVSDSEQVIYKTSDVGKIKVNFNDAIFESKNVTDEIQMITLNDIGFIGDTLGDASGNYQIANYNAYGKILKRTINPHIECLDKIYDGSPIVPIRVDNKYYHGFENSIDGDDIYLDTTYEGNRLDETHTFNKYGTTVFSFNDANVGENKIANLSTIFLEGYDSKNYKIGNIISNYQASIFKRPVNIIINKIKLIRSTRQWEVDYTIVNDIKTDKITMVYNSNDSLDIKVYGGVDNDGNSIHDDYNGKLDIINMFFNYPFNSHYNFVELNKEVTQINDSTAYWTNDARLAEPDTKRLDITVENDKNYPGEIKMSAVSIQNTSEFAYFESQNKDYKLYNGCKVTVTNIHLNPSNNKITNYTLLNSTYETEIEII